MSHIRNILTLISLLALCSTPIPARASTLWYSGDFDGAGGYGNRFDTTGNSGLPESKMFENFIVTDPNGWNISEIWSNNWNLGGTVTQADWSIRSGMAPGNGGNILFSGTSPVTVTPTGRSYQPNPGPGRPFPPNPEYTFLVSGLNLSLLPGEYWVNVTPYAQSDITISTSVGQNAVGIPPASDANALWWWSIPGQNYDNTGRGFSMGVGGNVGGNAAVPEPGGTLALLGIGAALLGIGAGLFGVGFSRQKQVGSRTEVA